MRTSRIRLGSVPAFASTAIALSFAVPPVGAQARPVQSERRISATEGGFGGDLDPVDELGGAVVSLGDLNGDGVGDVAVGAHVDDDGGNAQGAVWILSLNADGTAASEYKVSGTAGGFGRDLDADDPCEGEIQDEEASSLLSAGVAGRLELAACMCVVDPRRSRQVFGAGAGAGARRKTKRW